MPLAIDGWKVCSKCGERKPVSEFSKSRRTTDGLQDWCKLCMQIYSRAYYQTKREEILAQQKEYNATEAGRKVRRAIEGRFRQSSLGARIGRQNSRRRRACKVGLVGSHTYEEVLKLYELQNHRCLCCGELFPLEELTEDHVIPVGPGVSDRIDNIQLLCGPCNSSKGRQSLDYRRKEVPMS